MTTDTTTTPEPEAGRIVAFGFDPDAVPIAVSRDAVLAEAINLLALGLGTTASRVLGVEIYASDQPGVALLEATWEDDSTPSGLRAVQLLVPVVAR